MAAGRENRRLNQREALAMASAIRQFHPPIPSERQKRHVLGIERGVGHGQARRRQRSDAGKRPT